MKKSGRILVVDDNAGIRKTLQLLLPPYFETVELLPSPAGLVSALESFRPDVVLLDMNFHTDINSGNEGLYWTEQIRNIAPDVEVVLFTAYADIRLAVEAMRRGAFDFVVKPWENEKLISTLSAARDKARKTAKTPKNPAHEMYWGNSDKMAIIKQNVSKIAPTDATVLIMGENGTGKDLLANEIQRLSKRSLQPFVTIDASTIPETLFESEFFGHAKGAFTGAHADHTGKFEQANGGTLFLDEIGNIPLHLQAKLLRAIQNRNITRVGDNKAIPIDIRLICATNMDLNLLVREGRFREDLYYRINTVSLYLPPLRERKEDILPLAEMFIARFKEKYRRHISSISPDTIKKMQGFAWSGNIRELQNCIEKAVILSEKDIIDNIDLPEARVAASKNSEETLEQAEERIIRHAMDKYKGNLSLVAKALDISRPTLYKKLEKYGI